MAPELRHIDSDGVGAAFTEQKKFLEELIQLSRMFNRVNPD
jgi:hypothetical protein